MDDENERLLLTTLCVRVFETMRQDVSVSSYTSGEEDELLVFTMATRIDGSEMYK